MKAITQYSILDSVVLFLLGLVMPFSAIFFLDTFHLSMSMLGIVMAASGVVTFVTSIPSNLIADKFGIRKPMMIASAFGSAAAIFLLTVISSFSELMILMLVSGFFGGLGTVTSGFFAQLTKGKQRGAKAGLYNMFAGLSSAAAILIGAKAIEMFGFTYLFYIGSAACIIEGIMLFFISPEGAESLHPRSEKKHILPPGYYKNISEEGESFEENEVDEEDEMGEEDEEEGGHKKPSHHTAHAHEEEDEDEDESEKEGEHKKKHHSLNSE